MLPSVPFTARSRRRLLTTLSAVLVCILVPSAYAALALVGLVPMTRRIFVGWLLWLQVVHALAAVRLWPHREEFPTRIKAALIAWGGIAFWYWLPAPIYYLLTMSLDDVQLSWTALAFFWEVPVIGSAFLFLAGALFPSPRVVAHDPARQYRDLVRYPTVVAVLLFGFTLAGYVLGALQTRLFAAMPFVEGMKTLAHGVVISLLLAVFYQLALDRVVERVRGRIAREHGLGTIVARTVAGRITTVSMAVALSGFALIALFVLQAFQTMVADNIADVVRHDLERMTAGQARDLGVTRAWGPRARVFIVPAARALPAAEYSAATRRVTAGREAVVVRDSRRELKIVGLVAAPRLGGTLVGIAYLTDAYGPLRHAAEPLAFAGGCVLIVTVGMLVFASRASTQAVRALSQAVRRVESGEEDAAALRIETADEIGELSGVVERYVRQSRDLRENLEQKVREKTAELSSKLEEIQRADAALRRSAQRLEALQHIDRSILAAESADAIARTALPRLRRIVPYRWAGVLLFESAGEGAVARFMVTDGVGAPPEGQTVPVTDLPAAEALRTKGVRYLKDLRAFRCLPVFDHLLGAGSRSLISAPLVAGAETIGLLCVASDVPDAFGEDHTEMVSEVANQLAVAIHQARLRGALDLQQRRLNAVVDHIPEGVFLLERSGRVVLANPSAREHLQALTRLGPGGDVVAVGGLALAALLEQPEHAPREVLVAGPPRRVFQIAARRLDGPVPSAGCVVVVRDVTREREDQRAAQQQARLAAVGQLAAGIAHDFNNILMTIIASSELGQRHRGDPAVLGARLTTIVDQAERASALVRQILDFSRQSTPALQIVDLGVLVRQTVALLERTLPETIKIVCDATPARLTVHADPNQLSQVLTNLAVNARDAMPFGGELRFHITRRREVDRTGGRDGGPAPEWLVLEVSDTGTGMSVETRERVFEPFFTTKAPGRGTGLGLSQAYGILEQHGGHIGVESELGRGTTFSILLPALATDAAAAAGDGGGALAMGEGETVLVVEDEVAVRQAVAETLRDLQYEVLTAASAEEALALHEAHGERVALVITDLVMPGIGGLGLVRSLRAREARVPIVMMSGYVGESARDPVPGVVAWVQKPVTARRLGAVVREALAVG